MVLKIRCPRCGRLEEYEPSDEDMREAREKGLASISFWHGDHTLIVFFDTSASIRRSVVIKAAGARSGPAPRA